MNNLSISPDTSIKKALNKLGLSGEKCLIVVDENNIMLGTLTDGDIRNSILKGIDISDPIKNIYQSKPTYLVKGEYDINKVKKLFLKNKFNLIPVIDKKRKSC